ADKVVSSADIFIPDCDLQRLLGQIVKPNFVRKFLRRLSPDRTHLVELWVQGSLLHRGLVFGLFVLVRLQTGHSHFDVRVAVSVGVHGGELGTAHDPHVQRGFVGRVAQGQEQLPADLDQVIVFLHLHENKAHHHIIITKIKLLLQVDAEVLCLMSLHPLHGQTELPDEVEAERILTGPHQPQSFPEHVLLSDSVVRERLVPLGVQGLVDRLRAQFGRL
ncbi:hypothetical protein EGW08_013413, partial [Elysia chlorotica]